MAPIRCCFDQTAVWHSDAARGPSTPSFDHLVGAGKQRGRHVEDERAGGLHVDHQLKLGRLHDRQVGGLGALEDLTGVGADLTTHVHTIGRVAHQPAGFDSLASGIARGNPITRRERRKLDAPARKERYATCTFCLPSRNPAAWEKRPPISPFRSLLFPRRLLRSSTPWVCACSTAEHMELSPRSMAGHCSSAASPCSMSSGRASNRSNFSPTRGPENCGLVAAKAWPQASYPLLSTGSLGSTRGRCFMSCQRIPPRSSTANCVSVVSNLP